MDTPSVKDYIDARFATIDSVLRGELAEFQCKMNLEMEKRSGEFRVEMEKTRVEMHKNTADIIKWVVATVVAMTVANVSIMAFLLNRIESR